MNQGESQFIYVLRAARAEMLREGPSTNEAAILQDHSQYLERLAAEGSVLLAGRTQTSGPSTFGIVLIDYTTREHAAAIMSADPAVVGGVMTAELYPYSIAFVSRNILGGG